MDEKLPVLEPTFLRLRLIYAAFSLVIFIASVFLAILMADNGLSNMLHAENSRSYIVGMAFLVGGVIAVIGSAVFLFPALVQVWLAFQLEREGVIIDAVVIQKRLEKDQNGRLFCFIVYSYNNEFYIKQAIIQAEYEQLKEGEMVKVRYLPKSPATARLER
jgi:hypothetical protein